LFTDLDPHDPAYKPLESILANTEEEFNLGNLVEADDNIVASHWTKATRAYTRAQVTALKLFRLFIQYWKSRKISICRKHTDSNLVPIIAE
jgi:hypothetical protein